MGGQEGNGATWDVVAKDVFPEGSGWQLFSMNAKLPTPLRMGRDQGWWCEHSSQKHRGGEEF